MPNAKKNDLFEKYINTGKALFNEGFYKEAIKAYRTALIMIKNPDKFQRGSLAINLGNAYFKMGDTDSYRYYYEDYLKIYPEGQLSVFSRLAHAYYNLDVDKSVDYHDKALNLNVNEYDSACKLFAMIKSCFYRQQDIKECSEYEAEQIKNHFYKNIEKYNHDEKKKQKDKKLNIGYLSSDCHAHTMMNYMLPIWKNHNKNEFNIIIFNASSKNDETSKEIEKIGYKIVQCNNLKNEEIAKLIYDNDIDILVDLGGYTHLKCYCVFYKPAPVIIQYLGYLNTMGIKEVDYILTDRFSIPEDCAGLYTETPLYLDGTYQIYRNKKLPDIKESPYKKNGYITFGSFNCTSKINDTVIYLWSEILKKVPDAKFLVYRTQLTRDVMYNIRKKFEKCGISQDRLIFNSRSFDHLYKAYLEADISLDTFPFSGMSIAVETAFMGCPTVTLVGEGIQSKGAGGINKAMNLGELNADCGDEYIKIAVELANNKDKIDELKNSLRNRILNSDLFTKHKEFTQDLENKYRQVWNKFINSP